MRENADQNNSKYRHFSRIVSYNSLNMSAFDKCFQNHLKFKQKNFICYNKTNIARTVFLLIKSKKQKTWLVSEL